MLTTGRQLLVAVLLAGAVALILAAGARVWRVHRGAAVIPTYSDAREGGGRTRYFPHVLAWNDRSSARVQRMFAFDHFTSLAAIGRRADARLAQQGWYLVMPQDLNRIENPQVIVWQRDPDERLDLTQVWPLTGMTRDQRLYGGRFPAEFLDAPLVIEWDWALGGPRSPRPAEPPSPVIRRAPPPPEPPSN